MARGKTKAAVEENPSGNNVNMADLDPRYKQTVNKTDDAAQAAGWTAIFLHLCDGRGSFSLSCIRVAALA